MKARSVLASLGMLASACTRGDSTRATSDVPHSFDRLAVPSSPSLGELDSSLGAPGAGTDMQDASLATGPSQAGNSEQRIMPFAWRPPGGDPEAYVMPDSKDQHHLVLTRGVAAGGR